MMGGRLPEPLLPPTPPSSEEVEVVVAVRWLLLPLSTPLPKVDKRPQLRPLPPPPEEEMVPPAPFVPAEEEEQEVMAAMGRREG